MKLLTYLGAVPFFLAIGLDLFNYPFLGVDGTQWFITYSLVILSFMGGTLWGQVVNQSIDVKRVALASNTVTLTAWFAFLLASTQAALITFALGFIALYVLEMLVMRHVSRPHYYLGLRLRVTAFVVMAHCVMIYVV
ncbi:DUF3429 domain-containing protein [Pseudomonas sp. HK3]